VSVRNSSKFQEQDAGLKSPWLQEIAMRTLTIRVFFVLVSVGVLGSSYTASAQCLKVSKDDRYVLIEGSFDSEPPTPFTTITDLSAFASGKPDDAMVGQYMDEEEEQQELLVDIDKYQIGKGKCLKPVSPRKLKAKLMLKQVNEDCKVSFLVMNKEVSVQDVGGVQMPSYICGKSIKPTWTWYYSEKFAVYIVTMVHKSQGTRGPDEHGTNVHFFKAPK
jgi:hypothetical protein